MKGTCILLCSFMLVSSTFSARQLPSSRLQHHSYITEVVRVGPNASRVGLDKCTMCIEFADQFLDALLQFILQVGVADTCQDLCQALASVTKEIVGVVCNILCDVVGIKEFIKIIQKEDLDPIYYCELIPMCPVNDHGDAKFTSFTVDPKKGPQGTFDIAFEYVSVNGTGTGSLELDIATADGIPLGESFLHELAPAGTYDGTFKLKAQPDPECDPSQGPCEQWIPGNYTVKIALCNGECGSKHPHSAIYDEAQAAFVITGDLY